MPTHDYGQPSSDDFTSPSGAVSCQWSKGVLRLRSCQPLGWLRYCYLHRDCALQVTRQVQGISTRYVLPMVNADHPLRTRPV